MDDIQVFQSLCQVFTLFQIINSLFCVATVLTDATFIILALRKSGGISGFPVITDTEIYQTVVSYWFVFPIKKTGGKQVIVSSRLIIMNG
jgi:hypothetical protein